MKSNKKSIGDLKETPVEGPPRAESSACKMDWKSSFAIPGSETKKERGGNDTILHEKQRITGRRSKVALVPADANRSNSGEETILQEKDPLVPAGAHTSNGGADAERFKRCHMYWLAGIILLIACIGAVVGIVVSLQKSDSPATLPVDFPSASPTFFEGLLVELIQSRSPTTSFVNSTSAQSQALDWMLSDPYTLTIEDDRSVQ